MKKFSEDWHKQDIADEMKELEEAKGFLHRWSELSDVVYTVTRAHWSGHKRIKWPLKKWQYWYGIVYMFPKYTLRWLLFFIVGKTIDPKKRVAAVRNPKKPQKSHDTAVECGVDPEIFTKRVEKLRKIWPLLK